MRTGKKKSLDDSPRKRKLRMQVLKLKKQNNKLRQMVRRLRLKKEKQKKSQTENQEINEGTSDANNILRLGGKLFSGHFVQLLSAQINALTKNKRGRRYDSDFKQFALSLFFQVRVLIENC